MHPSILLLSLTLILPLSAATSPPPQQYIEVTRPLPFDPLTPSCTLPLLSHLNTTNATYSSPSNCTWSNAVLHFSAASNATNYHRIAAVWLSGVELLRTSTPEPHPDGIFWTFRKDITRYASLLRRSNLTLSVAGIHGANVTFLYYDVNRTDHEISSHKLGGESLELNMNPANLIIPISSTKDAEPSWFKIEHESESISRGIQIPSNTYRAVVEIYVSSHGNDEFWYANPPDYYIEMNNITTEHGHGAYREILLNLDDNVVGSVIPFPIIYSGGIDPLFWKPILSIGAFDLPSYEVELTPFLGMMLDENPNFLGFEVANSIPYWLIGANLHLWLDEDSERVLAAPIKYNDPKSCVERSSKFHELDGKFKTEGKRKTEVSGWVSSAAGNFTTHVWSKVEFENKVVFKNNGTSKTVKQEVKVVEKVEVKSALGHPVSNVSRERRYPLRLSTTGMPGSERDSFLISAEVEHSLKEEKKENGDFSSKFENRQKSRGWMFTRGGDILSGAATTSQSYHAKDSCGCYSRRLVAENGEIRNDTHNFICSTTASS